MPPPPPPPPAAGRLRPAKALQVVGYVLHRWFSAPLPFDAAGARTFSLSSERLPPVLGQFQEVLNIVLESLPRVDWERCRAGDAMVSLMVRQLREAPGRRADDRLRGEEPRNEQDVFMDLPHNDEYWPGADLYVVSDGPLRTLFYPGGAEGLAVRFPERAVVRYEASSLHSAPGVCPAGSDVDGDASRAGGPAGRVLRTFVRVMAWDPAWNLRRLPHFAALLGPAPESEWTRPRTCEAEDVVHGCFDAEHTCEKCCDLSKGPLGDSVCWAGWMTYQKCCGPASRRWAGCGWRRGADLWAHEYYSLTPPRLHSPAQCQQRCEEDPDCGGWTYFPEAWRPQGCRLPLAALLGLRRTCVLRRGAADHPPTPHRGLVWGPRDCQGGDADDDSCWELDSDRLSWELEIRQNIADPWACRALCRRREGCQAFAFFPSDYTGEASEGCVLPAAVHAFWETRCLLKSQPTHGGQQWFLPMGNVVSAQRSCLPAAPWVQTASEGSSDQDVRLAVDDDYGRGRCSSRNPWRLNFDAEYVVAGAVLWVGDLGDLQDRDLRTYSVSLLVAGAAGDEEDEVPCGSAREGTGGRPLTVQCPSGGPAARGLAVRASGGGGGGGAGGGGARAVVAERASVCEVEVRVEPVPCQDLIAEVVTIGAWERRVFPAGAARRLPMATPAGQACERYGGSLVAVAAKGGAVVCVEATCAPSECLEVFDASLHTYAGVSGFTVWDPQIEPASQMCARYPESIGGGRYFETTVRVLEAPQEEGARGSMATLHFGFCAPAMCADDDAATVALRLAAGKGIELHNLRPGASVSIQNVRPFGRWEDVDLDFLVAGFARSGTHTVQLNLAQHPQCQVSREELTFNWGYLPMWGQLREYERYLRGGPAVDDVPPPQPRLRGGKGEGVALSPRLLRLLARAPKLRLILVVREPTEWLESIYNLRAWGCHQRGDCGAVPSLADVVLGGATLEDVRVDFAELARAVEDAMKYFPPGAGRLLVLEFELLRARPREFFDRITDFLGIAPFPLNFTFGKFATGDRKAYTAEGVRADLCRDPDLRPSLEALRERLRARGEHRRLAELIAASGQPWVSSRLLLGRDHCAG